MTGWNSVLSTETGSLMIWGSVRNADAGTSRKSLTVNNLKERTAVVCKVINVLERKKDNLRLNI